MLERHIQEERFLFWPLFHCGRHHERGKRRLQTYHLVSEHEDGFETKLALAVVEEILKTRPEQVDNHDVVVALDAEPVHIWDTNYSAKKGNKVRKSVKLIKNSPENIIKPANLIIKD